MRKPFRTYRTQCSHSGHSKGEQLEKGTESLFKAIMAENFTNLGREMIIYNHEAQKTPPKLSPYRFTGNTLSLSKIKVNDSKAAREKRLYT